MMNEKRLILRNAGQVDPWSIDSFIANGGYKSFQHAIKKSSVELLETINQSGLKGRGGAGFSTGFKTNATAQSEAICLKYIVCNADEGEPGTFKDRMIMEQDPHSIIEGMLIAAKAIGAIWGYIYIRGEYLDSISKLKNAISQAKQKHLIGANILGTDFSFHLEVMIGAGSYLCGEELTLLESLEGKRGYPRIKPPFPAQKGLWQQPTLVNNVETLANLPVLFDIGIEKYLATGTKASPGTKLICLSGDVVSPGTYEVEMGCNLHDIIYELAGGIPDGNKLKAVLLGGAAGTFANPEQLDTQIGYAEMRDKGLTLGSGAMIVISEKSSLSKMLTAILEFFKHESCGKCVPCRLGTTHMLDIWNEYADGNIENKKKALYEIKAMAEEIAASSLCPLGQSPILPLRSFIQNCIHQLD